MRLCRDCIHDGCCDGLPYCGGTKWKPARVQCEKCGEWFWYDEIGADNLCEDCFAAKEEEEDCQ